MKPFSRVKVAPSLPTATDAPTPPRQDPPPASGVFNALAAWTAATAAVAVFVAIHGIAFLSDRYVGIVDPIIGERLRYGDQVAIPLMIGVALYAVATTAALVARFPEARRMTVGWHAFVTLLALGAVVRSEVFWGWALAVPAAAAALVAARHPDLPAALERRDDGLQRALQRTVEAIVRRFQQTPVTTMAWGFIVLGIIARIASPFVMDMRMDGAVYTAMGKSIAEGLGLTMPYGPVTSLVAKPPTPSHHYPPAYPFYLAMYYKVLGFGLWQTRVAHVVLSLAAMAVTYVLTRDLYGHERGLAVTAIVAVMPTLLLTTGMGFSENMVLIFFALTLWGIIKSLQKEPYIVVAGAAAGLAYLTRSSMGIFFLVAGIGGFLWRWLYMKWRVFTNVWYLMAIAVFFSMVIAWVARNMREFGGFPGWQTPWAEPASLVTHLGDSTGTLVAVLLTVVIGGGILWIGRPRPETPGSNGLPPAVTPRIYAAASVFIAIVGAFIVAWLGRELELRGSPSWETSEYTGWAFDEATANPDLWATGLLYKAVLFVLLFLPYVVAFWPEVKRSWARVREEHESALWMGVGLITLISWFVAAMFWVMEESGVFWLDNLRYIVVAFVPLAWMGVKHADLRSPRFRARFYAIGLVMTIAMAGVIASPTQFPEADAMKSLELEPGDRLAIDGTHKYLGFPYMNEHDVEVIGWGTDLLRVDYILSWNKPADTEYKNFHQIGYYEVDYLFGGTATATVWEYDYRR